MKANLSKCPKCGKILSWRNLIPVFSFLFQKGRCSFCSKKISWFYFLIEIILSFIFKTFGFLIIILYYSLKVRVYTGASFGYRWLIAITPLLYFFLLLLFTKKRSYNFLLLFTTTTAISIVVALIGFLNPWGRTLADILLSNGQIVKIDFPLLVSIMVLFE